MDELTFSVFKQTFAVKALFSKAWLVLAALTQHQFFGRWLKGS
jgi:hypothetical protein